MFNHHDIDGGELQEALRASGLSDPIWEMLAGTMGAYSVSYQLIIQAKGLLRHLAAMETNGDDAAVDEYNEENHTSFKMVGVKEDLMRRIRETTLEANGLIQASNLGTHVEEVKVTGRGTLQAKVAQKVLDAARVRMGKGKGWKGKETAEDLQGKPPKSDAIIEIADWLEGKGGLLETMDRFPEHKAMFNLVSLKDTYPEGTLSNLIMYHGENESNQACRDVMGCRGYKLAERFYKVQESLHLAMDQSAHKGEDTRDFTLIKCDKVGVYILASKNPAERKGGAQLYMGKVKEEEFFWPIGAKETPVLKHKGFVYYRTDSFRENWCLVRETSTTFWGYAATGIAMRIAGSDAPLTDLYWLSYMCACRQVTWGFD